MQDNQCIHEKIFRQYDPLGNPPFKNRAWGQLSKKEKRKIHDWPSVKNALMRCSEHCRNAVRDK